MVSGYVYEARIKLLELIKYCGKETPVPLALQRGKNLKREMFLVGLIIQ